MSLLWVQASATEDNHETYYHLTDNPRFSPDKDFEPHNNTTLGGTFRPGLFMAKHPESWINGHNYIRPFVAEMHVPHHVLEHPDVMRNGYHGEVHVPGHLLDHVKVNRVIPTDAHCREEYGAHGWIESHHGTEFDTGNPTEDPSRTGWQKHYPFGDFHKGSTYHYPGPDARDMSDEEVQRHRDRAKGLLDYHNRDAPSYDD